MSRLQDEVIREITRRFDENQRAIRHFESEIINPRATAENKNAKMMGVCDALEDFNLSVTGYLDKYNSQVQRGWE